MVQDTVDREFLMNNPEYYVVQHLFPEEMFTNWLPRGNGPDVFHKKGFSNVALVDLSTGICYRKRDKSLKKQCKRAGKTIV